MNEISFLESEIPVQEDRIVIIEDNFRILLHNLDEVLWLEDGEIDLFVLSPTGNAAELPLEIYATLAEHYNSFIDTFIDGSLYYFGTCSTGQIIFPFPLHREQGEHDYKVIGVANVQSRIKRIPLKELTEVLQRKPQYVRDFENHLKKWLSIIEQLLYKLRTLDVTQELFLEQPLTISKGNIVSVSKHSAKEAKEKLLWVQINSGNCQVQGIKNVFFSLDTPIIPAIPFLWLQAETDSSLFLAECSDWYSRPGYIKGIFDFHSLFLLLLKFLNEYKLIKKKELAKVAIEREKFLMVLSRKLLTSVTEKEFLHRNTFNIQHKFIDPIQTICDFLRIPLFCPPTIRLTGMKHVVYELTESSRLCYRKVSLKKDWQNNADGPLLVFQKGTQGTESAVFFPNAESRYVERDSITGKYKPLSPNTIKNTEKTAYLFYQMLPRKATLSTSEVMAFTLENTWRDLLLILIVGMLGSAMGLTFPIITMVLFDYVIPNPGTDLQKYILGGLILVVLVSASAAFNFVKESSFLRWNGVIRFKLLSGIWMRLFDLPMSFFRKLSAGQILQRMDALEGLQLELTQDVVKMGLSGLFCLILLLWMFLYAPQLAFIVLVIACLNIISMIFFYLFSLSTSKKVLEEYSDMYSFVMSMIFGISKIRTNAVENFVFARWAQKMTNLKKYHYQLERLKSLSWVSNYCFTYISILLIFVFITYYSSNILTNPQEIISTGSFIAFFMSFLLFSQIMADFGKSLIHTTDVIPTWKMCQPIIHEKIEILEGKVHPGILTGEISVESICFRYNPHDTPLLKNININVLPGEIIAIVGRSGCGKSTIFRLLLGFEKLEAGAIYLNGQDLAQLDPREVRRQMGVMLQTNQIMSTTIRETVADGRPVSDEEVLEALRIAEFLDVLHTFPKGLDTVITTGGVALSGGQKQRLLLARAVVQRPKILLLDEFTGSLDVATEEKIIQNLDRLGATQIIISQRLYALKHVDRIYVIQDGEVKESGSFEDLILLNGWFSKTLLTHATGIQI